MINGHKTVKINTILKGEIEVTMIQLGKKSEYEISEYVDKVKKQLRDINSNKREEYINFYNKMRDDEDGIKEQYLQLKSQLAMSSNGTEVTDESLKSHIKRFKEKYLKEKSIDKIIDELADLNVDTINMKRIIDVTIAKTLQCVLRNTEDLKIKVFETIDDIDENLDDTMLYDVFKQYNDNSQVGDDEIKN